jgi:hypothetical protein
MDHLLRLIPVTTAAVLATFFSGVAFGDATETLVVGCSGPLKADFSTYWLCARYLLGGGDPFDPSQIKNFATSLGCQVTGPSYISPWFLILLFPFASLPLDVAATLWLVLNMGMIAHIVTWTFRSHLAQRLPRPTITLALIASPGIVACLIFGQFGIACLWGMLMAAELYQRSGRLMPLALIIGSLKPHIAWLYWIAVGKLLIQERKFRVISETAILAILSCIFVFLWAPGSYESWRRVYGSALSWMGASVATPIRILFSTSGDPAPLWPVVLIMSLAIIFTTYRLRKPASQIDPRVELPWLVALSICATPYVWSFDFCVLLPAEIIALSGLLTRDSKGDTRRLISPILIIFARLGLLIQMTILGGDWRTWWYSAVVTVALFHHLWRSKVRAKSYNAGEFRGA